MTPLIALLIIIATMVVIFLITLPWATYDGVLETMRPTDTLAWNYCIVGVTYSAMVLVLVFTDQGEDKMLYSLEVIWIVVLYAFYFTWVKYLASRNYSNRNFHVY